MTKGIGGHTRPNHGATNGLDVHIRWMIRRDMLEVLNIEAASFEFPWCEEDFIRCLRQRNCIGMVAEHDDRVVGFMIYELHKSHIHLLDLAVDTWCRRRRVGTQLINKLARKLSWRRRARITVEVSESNLPGQLFFRQMGFRAIRIARYFYDGYDEDAYVMQHELSH